MRATISTGLFILVIGCGGRTLLDDPSNELLTSTGHDSGIGSSQEPDAGGHDGNTPTKVPDAGKTGTMACGTMKCDTATEECCGTMTGAMSGAASCVPQGTCNGVTVMCTSAADCPNKDVCCASFGGGTGGGMTGGGGGAGGLSVACARSCAGGGFQLCSADSECSKGVTCQSTPFGAKICGGIGGALGGGGFGGGGFGGGGLPQH